MAKFSLDSRVGVKLMKALDAEKDEYCAGNGKSSPMYVVSGDNHYVYYKPRDKELTIGSQVYAGCVGLENATIDELILLLTGLRENELAKRVCALLS